MNRTLGSIVSLFCLVGSATGFAQASIEGFGVGKKRDYLQSSPATPTSQAILGDPAGPYHFSADLSGSALNLFSPAPKVTTPLSVQYTLVGDATDRGILGDYTTKNALDAAFPNGTYTFTAGASSLPISLGASDGYPTDIPRISNGTWDAQGRLVAGAWTATTLNFSNFSEYSSGLGGIIIFNLYALSGTTVGNEMVSLDSTNLTGMLTQPALTSYTIPAAALQPDTTYYAELSFSRIADLNLSFINQLGEGPVGVASFVHTTGFIISTHTMPVILQQPASQTKLAGQTVHFASSVTVHSPLPTFQWQRLPAGSGVWNNLSDDANILGTTTENLTINSVTFAMNGDQFRMVATNGAGSVASTSALLTVNAAVVPTMVGQPSSLNVNQGLTASFSGFATGTEPLSYQWYRDGQSISGATQGMLTIPNVQLANTGSYTLVASNAGGSVTSNPAVLGLNSPLGVVATAAGGFSSFFIQSDGSLWAMGNNEMGRLGDGTTVDRANAKQITTGVVSVAAGRTHALFIKADGTLWSMGGNEYGQLGDGTNTDRSVPVQVATGVIAAAGGYAHSLFLKADGTLWGVGANYVGQLGDGTEVVSRMNPVQIATRVVSFAAGETHTLFIKSDGTLWATGSNEFGQFGDGTANARRTPIQIATGVVSAAAGYGNTLYVKTDGTLWSMGYNQNGQLGDGTIINRNTPAQIAANVSSVTAGLYHALFIKTDGTLWAMGDNYLGEIGDGTNINRKTPVQVATGVAQVEASRDHSIFRKTDGSLWTMGGNYYGQLGKGTKTDYISVTVNNSPSQISNGPLSLPAAPTGVSAVEGSPANCIVVTWSQTIGASRYEVWRNITNDSATAVRIADAVPIALHYDLTATAGTNYFYWIKAANPSGTSSFSASDSGVIGAPPTFTTQPVSQIATVGASVTFSVVATGAPAPTLQWQKNGADIGGATGSSYSIDNVAAGDVGSYTVVATNSVGASTSNPATLALGTIPDGFDMTAYLTRYPDVAAIYGANPYVAWIHYRDVGIYQGEVFDELFRVEEYLTLYPELFAVFGTDLGGALVHWLNEGRIEGRLGRIPLEFNAQGYFDRNPDVAAAAGNNPLLAWSHYWLYGIYEGRAYDEELDVFQYLAINADLTAAFVNDWRAAALHWMRYGRTEGRLGRLPLLFNVNEYLTRSPDVAAVWGTHPTTVFLHYWGYGIDEGRTFDDEFRPVEYLALNPDLAAVFGTDKRGAFKHWVRYGKSEGRPGKNP